MIRKAVDKDIDSIFNIYRKCWLDKTRLHDSAYCVHVQRNGFLQDMYDREFIAERIKNSVIFNVYELEGNIVGYIDFDREIYFPENAPNIIWLDPTKKNLYFNDSRSTVLHTIAVDYDYNGKGIGTELFKNATEELIRNNLKFVFSIIVLAPVTNCASLMFHTKNDFERACVTMPIELFGFKNYQSLLFFKDIA